MANTRFDSKDVVVDETIKQLAMNTGKLPTYFNKTNLNNEPNPKEINANYIYILKDEVASKTYICVIVDNVTKKIEIT